MSSSDCSLNSSFISCVMCLKTKATRLTDDITFSIYSVFLPSPTCSPVFPFGSSGPQRRRHPPPHLLCSWAYCLIYLSALPPFHFHPPSPPPQTDQTSSDERKACVAEERGCIPTLSSYRAAHLHYTWRAHRSLTSP